MLYYTINFDSDGAIVLEGVANSVEELKKVISKPCTIFYTTENAISNISLFTSNLLKYSNAKTKIWEGPLYTPKYIIDGDNDFVYTNLIELEKVLHKKYPRQGIKNRRKNHLRRLQETYANGVKVKEEWIEFSKTNKDGRY